MLAAPMEEPKKSLQRNPGRLALRALPLALAMVAVAHATPTFNAPNASSQISSTCGHDVTTTQALAGLVTNGGRGLSLSGAATTNVSGSACAFEFTWQGTGTGSFNGSTATAGANFTITSVLFAKIQSWVLTVTLNGGSPQTLGSCIAGDTVVCTGSVSFSNQSITVPASLSTWTADLRVNVDPDDGGGVTVDVPSATSIDILAPAAADTAPALTPLALAVTAIVLLALGLYLMRGRVSHSGTPGLPS